uniref:Uncharacterized protein n=1 Tax=Caenorhabditis tropicalis TaxID=1561998 RepID=A0A1I7T5A0_9PELO
MNWEYSRSDDVGDVLNPEPASSSSVSSLLSNSTFTLAVVTTLSETLVFHASPPPSFSRQSDRRLLFIAFARFAFCLQTVRPLFPFYSSYRDPLHHLHFSPGFFMSAFKLAQSNELK